MNRSELVDAVASQAGYSKAHVEGWLDAFVTTLGKNMKKPDGVKLVGFGTFKTAKRKARMGRNPQTGAEIKIPARTTPVFRPGRELKAAIDKK